MAASPVRGLNVSPRRTTVRTIGWAVGAAAGVAAGAGVAPRGAHALTLNASAI
jgi:membrane-associated PAP2 superfamily phosphatase